MIQTNKLGALKHAFTVHEMKLDDFPNVVVTGGLKPLNQNSGFWIKTLDDGKWIVESHQTVGRYMAFCHCSYG